MTYNLIKWVLILFTISNVPGQTHKTLNKVFANALISDSVNNIQRKYPIKVIASNEYQKKIKTNYKNLKNLLIKGENDIPWFITQGEEASTIVEIKHVDVNTGWISLGKTLSGYLNLDDGETLEFFNPFVNYKIINNQPILNNYPTYIEDERINYIQSGGIIKRQENDYVLLTPVVFGAHQKRVIYYATSHNLEDWTFHSKKILDAEQITFAKKDGNIFSTGNPLTLENNNLLVLLGIERTDNSYCSAYMIINKNLEIIQKPKEIKLSNLELIKNNNYPLAITKFNELYRLLIYNRTESEIHEITTKDLFKTLDKSENILSLKTIHKGKQESGYLNGKADDASYIKFNSELYILIGSEEYPSQYLTSLNREYGLMHLNNDIWEHDNRSPLIINPISIYHKFPELEWTNDHLGGFISPIFKDNYMYLFLTFGSDNPDYLISGIKIKLD